MYCIFTQLKKGTGMSVAIYSILIVLAIILIVLIVKEHLAYKKEFGASLNREYNSRLKNEFEGAEE
jgi:uncharacterized membrane protein